MSLDRRRALMMALGEPAPEPNGLVDGTYTNEATSQWSSKWSISVLSNVCTQVDSTGDIPVVSNKQILIPLKSEIEVKSGDVFSMLQRDGAVLDGPGAGCETWLYNRNGTNILKFGTGFRPQKNIKYSGTASADATATHIKFVPMGSRLKGTRTFVFELYKGTDRIF